jgi:hypothetical protein
MTIDQNSRSSDMNSRGVIKWHLAISGTNSQELTMYARPFKISLGIINLDEDKAEMFGKVASGCPRLRGPHEDPSNALQLRQQNSISKRLRLARTRRYRDAVGPRMEHKSSRGRDEFSCIRRLERPRRRNRSTHDFSKSAVLAPAKRIVGNDHYCKPVHMHTRRYLLCCTTLKILKLGSRPGRESTFRARRHREWRLWVKELIA